MEVALGSSLAGQETALVASIGQEEIDVDAPARNEAKRGAQGSLVTSMGRMAAHTGQEITSKTSSTASMNSPHRGPTDDGFPGSGPGRPGRHVSQTHARHHQEAGILTRLNTQFSHFP